MNGFIITQLATMNHIQVSRSPDQLANSGQLAHGDRLAGLASTGGAGE